MKLLKAISIAVLICCGTALQAQTHTLAAMVGHHALARFAKLAVDTDAYDFGQIAQGTPVTATFAITNTGNAPLQMVDVKGSCGCTVVDYTQSEIAPGQTGTVQATYNAKHKGAFNKTVTVTSNAENPVQVLHITGEVI